MRTVLFAALLAAFSLGIVTTPAFAQESCKSKAIGKDGKPLAGAALNSFMAKCAKDACEPKAIDNQRQAACRSGQGQLYEEMPRHSMRDRDAAAPLHER